MQPKIGMLIFGVVSILFGLDLSLTGGTYRGVTLPPAGGVIAIIFGFLILIFCGFRKSGK